MRSADATAEFAGTLLRRMMRLFGTRRSPLSDWKRKKRNSEELKRARRTKVPRPCWRSSTASATS
ncbi:hypothetical protein ACVMIL_009162 [Bradyrhizobium barranii subsp. barranii]